MYAGLTEFVEAYGQQLTIELTNLEDLKSGSTLVTVFT